MNADLKVAPGGLRRVWDPEQFDFSTTEGLPELEGLVGQERAVKALSFGLSMHSPGYNIYVAGPAGTGKTSYTRKLVGDHARQRPVADDWVYVYNFEQPDEPLALRLPPGTAVPFAAAVEELVHDAQTAVGQAFSANAYQARREEMARQVRLAIGGMLEDLEVHARDAGFAMTQTEGGLMPVAMLNGQPLTEEQFSKLLPDARREISERADQIQAAIAQAGRRKREMERDLLVQLKELDKQLVQTAVAPILDHMKDRYQDQPRILHWLESLERELTGLIALVGQGAPMGEEKLPPAEMALLAMRQKRRVDPMARFRVNTFVHRSPGEGAPVVVEPNPTYVNLFGKAEFVPTAEDQAAESVMHIKPGAIHRANGGYLILQVADLLRSPHAWEALKRALGAGEARIEVPGQENRVLPVEVVRPEPIPLNVKVIIIGSAGVYQGLYAYDETFRKQFKVKAEFDVALEADAANVAGYCAFIASVCRREGLAHLTKDAVAHVLEHSHRLAEDQTKLSARFNEAVEVIYEANALAASEGSPHVTGMHVRRAIREKAERSAAAELHMQEAIQRGTVIVDVTGEVVGQVNGLTVMSIGDHRFGSPSRITARVHIGEKGILHIEREIAMSGQIHDKGVLTLSGFLGDRFAQERPLALSASIAFEQTYVPVDGDSASSTELYALLSALSGVPINQGIAVTGSVNQRGQVQPIGGVNEKIEGFYRVCRSIGLTGRQGVMIPARNLPNLVLDPEVVEAVRLGSFHIWAVHTIEEGIEILTGMPAGERGADGQYPPGTLFAKVDRRLEEMARRLFAWHQGKYSVDLKG